MKNKAIAPTRWALDAIIFVAFVAFVALADQPQPPNVAMSALLVPTQTPADVPVAFGSGAGVHGRSARLHPRAAGAQSKTAAYPRLHVEARQF